MSYAAEHASTLADIRDAGAAVTFTPPLGSTASAVAGYAMQVGGNPVKYAALGLVESEAPTLFFVPSAYGARPMLNGTCTFGGVVFAVRDEAPFMPDGTAIFSKVVVVR